MGDVLAYANDTIVLVLDRRHIEMIDTTLRDYKVISALLIREFMPNPAVMCVTDPAVNLIHCEDYPTAIL